jgi:FKBP-type peptidyl-prolyl cis-trans isomerase FkpA
VIPLLCGIMSFSCAGGMQRPSDPAEVAFAPDLGIDLTTMTMLPGRLYFSDIRPGDGEEAKRNSTVRVLYTGKLPDGTIFDASRDETDAVQFRLGDGQVIRGWEDGIVGMRVGGLRRLVVPPALAYGRRGTTAVPSNATLVFEILLVGVN